MPLECDDYISMFDDDSEELPPSLSSCLPAVNEKTGPPVSALELVDDIEWQNDPVPVKLEKIRAAFLNSRTAGEVMAAGSTMQIGDWLELVVKLSPKNIQVSGGLSFKHMLEEMGPIDKNDYRPKQIECQCEDIQA